MINYTWPLNGTLAMERSMLRLVGTLALLAFSLTLPAPAGASGDLFGFSASQGAFHFSLQMTGRQDPGVVQVSSSDFKDYMPRRDYYIEFDRAQKRAFIRPRTRDGLPWFEMDVVGNKGVLHYNGRRMEGTADWTIW